MPAGEFSGEQTHFAKSRVRTVVCRKRGSYFSDAPSFIDAKRWIRCGLRAAEDSSFMSDRDGKGRKIHCAGGNERVFRATVQALRPYFAGAGEQTLSEAGSLTRNMAQKPAAGTEWL